ncbi:hypothetical protein [Halomarina litorea]|uniref:hypothetical protein n=1 Tax=Halomarina litorea TaxID=2961595 RepID=UPI0020C1C664|nr:hypothetical protein [Halomarina sp. BCD28]
MAHSTHRTTDAPNQELYIAVYEVTDSAGWSSRYVDQIRASDLEAARRSAEASKPGAANDTCRLVEVVRKHD